MWMILYDPGPQQQSLQTKQSSIEAHMSWQHLLSRPSGEKREETAQKQFLSRPSAQQGQIHVFPEGNQLYGHQIHVVWLTWHTPNTPIITPEALLKTPPASFPSRESSMEPNSEDSSPKGRKRHQSEPAFIWPHDIDQGLSHGLSALLTEMSLLEPYRIQWQAKVKAQEKISTHKWLLSRPFGTDTVNWLISRPLCIQTELAAFKTIWDIHSGLNLHGPFWLLSRPSHLIHSG